MKLNFETLDESSDCILFNGNNLGDYSELVDIQKDALYFHGRKDELIALLNKGVYQ
jgi:hypothetical protein